MIKNTINIEAKISLQSPLEIKKIDPRYQKVYKPSTKKDKDKTSYEYENKNIDKTKFYSFSSANTN